LPLAALAQLSLPVAATARGAARVQLAQAARAQATEALNLQAAARADLRAMAGASATLRLAAIAPGLLAAPGSCGHPCPVATFEPIAKAV
jgi:hypothetical protein